MPAAALNAFHTIYLRHVLEESGATETDYTITVNNHPLPRTDDGLVLYMLCINYISVFYCVMLSVLPKVHNILVVMNSWYYFVVLIFWSMYYRWILLNRTFWALLYQFWSCLDWHF